jgi:hypothetical protein
MTGKIPDSFTIVGLSKEEIDNVADICKVPRKKRTAKFYKQVANKMSADLNQWIDNGSVWNEFLFDICNEVMNK